jgi:hypothetical protein
VEQTLFRFVILIETADLGSIAAEFQQSGGGAGGIETSINTSEFEAGFVVADAARYNEHVVSAPHSMDENAGASRHRPIVAAFAWPFTVPIAERSCSAP